MNKITRKFNGYDFLILLGILGLVIVNHFAFDKVLKLSYWKWYVKEGAVISWIASLFALIWGDLNRNPWIIASRPLEYLMGNSVIMSFVFYSIAPPSDEIFSKRDIYTLYHLDKYFGLLLLVILSIVLLSWLLVIVPIQYFLLLFTGAPARMMVYSNTTRIAQIDMKAIFFRTGSIKRGTPVPVDWWSISIADKPVSFAFGLTAMIIWIVKIILSWKGIV